ncbi:MAG TPA: Fic family protein [Candidatus Sulfotelmatobacter sp.]|jgi:Fic family protein|nr:Fic family protein [Candidatus Sulfotelmatobacter sp.]
MYNPKYSINNTILKNIGIIEAAREVIDHAPLLPYYEKEFQKDAMIRSVHHGTHIEGNELNLDQAEKVIDGQEVVARQRDIQEVINYRKVMQYLGELQGEVKIDEEFIKKLHGMTVEKLLPAEKCGEFRITQVVVKNSLTGEVTFTPPVALVVPVQIKEFVGFINNSSPEDIHPVLKSGIVHYELVRIHPFIDGNGRVSRALSTFILFQEGYDIRKFFSLEEYFDNDATEYYRALQSVGKNDGDLTQWLVYFTQGLAIELSKIKEKIEKISVDAGLKERQGGTPILLSDRQLKIMEYIQKVGYLQNNGFKQIFPMVSEDTVLNELKYLLKHGLIKKTGSTKGAKYVRV